MGEEKTSEMNINIVKRVRYYLVFFAFIILIQICGEELNQLVITSLTGDQNNLETSIKIISSIILMISTVAIIVLNLGRDIDLHNLLDSKLFHVRKKTGDIIYKHIMDAAQALNAVEYEKIRDKKQDVMCLFYHFANEQTVLRELSFTYWEQYFVNIYIIVFSTLGFICSLITMLLQWKTQTVSAIPLIFVAIGLAVGCGTRCSLVRKIYGLPKQQIDEIRSSKTEELRKEIKARFA